MGKNIRIGLWKERVVTQSKEGQYGERIASCILGTIEADRNSLMKKAEDSRKLYQV